LPLMPPSVHAAAEVLLDRVDACAGSR
jgi:hypothetical protein